MDLPVGALVTIESVRQLAQAHAVLGHLDLPKGGDHVRGRTLRLVGWALGSETARARHVELQANERVLATVPLDQSRPDVAATFPGYAGADRSGFTVTVPLLGLQPLELRVDMILEDERRVPLAGVQARLRLAEQAWAGSATLASVVLTSQNGDALTARAIESVLAQTYPNFELLLVTKSDDGLPGALAQRYPNVEIVESSPGMAAARNAGLQASAGAAVVFLDSNERLLPTALQRGLRELAALPECAFVSGKCVVTREYHDDAEYPQQPLITADHYAVLLGRNYVLTPGAAIFRRAALEAVGGFDETLDAYADYDLYLRLAREFQVGTHPEAVVESPGDDPLRGAAENRAALDRVLDAQEARVAGDHRLETALRHGRNAWQRRLGETTEDAPPPVGSLDFGHLRRVSPISTNFGFERGRPVDRYFIESFLADHAADVRGHVLEVQENDYTFRFGGDGVEQSDVLSLLPDNPKATIVGDLATGETIPAAAFDCVIVTQVLHLVHDPREAVQTIRRILKPCGVALVTVPGISQVEWSESWHWSFTLLSARQMFSDVFGEANVRARAYGNVLAATSFLWGIAVEELDPAELDVPDPNYPVTIAVRAARSGAP